MPDTPLNPDGVLHAMDTLMAETDTDERATEWAHKVTTRVLEGYFAVSQPEVNSVEELDALPLGVTVLGADMIAYQMLGDASFPDGRFRETSWWACGNEYEVTSIPLPARVLYRPNEGGHDGR